MNARLAWLALLGILAACSREPGAGDDTAAVSLDPKSSAVFGQAPQNDPPEVARRTATRAVASASSQCGGGCSADLEAGREHLAQGRMGEAFEALRCGDTPAAAFGAGIAKLLGIASGAAGDQLLRDAGQPHFPSTDLFGPDGYLARMAARWNGSAQLTVSGARSFTVATGRVMADDWELSLRHNDGARRISLYVETEAGHAAGTVLAVRYDCANAGRAAGPLPRVILYLYEGEVQLDCEVQPSRSPAGCTPDGGSMRVVSSGVTPGSQAAFEFEQLQLTCESDGSQIADVAGPLTVTLDGSVSATVTGDVDTSDLHRAFDGEKDETLIERLDPALTVADFMNHGAAIAGELAVARCYFDKAAQGSGTVFTVPGSLHAGKDLALDAGDARMFGAVAAGGAALIQLAGSYEYGLPLRTLMCLTHNDLGEHPQCPTETAFVESANQHWKQARIRHDRVEASQQLLTLALADFEAGVEQLNANSALVRNSVSAPGWRTARDFVQAAQRSLAEGNLAIPHVAPAIHVDLRSFFAEPPDPSSIQMPLLTLAAPECSEDCESELRIEPAYVSEFLDDTDADFEAGDYQFSESDALEEGLREVLLQLDAAGLFTDG